jgi:hypothetical protein
MEIAHIISALAWFIVSPLFLLIWGRIRPKAGERQLSNAGVLSSTTFLMGTVLFAVLGCWYMYGILSGQLPAKMMHASPDVMILVYSDKSDQLFRSYPTACRSEATMVLLS